MDARTTKPKLLPAKNYLAMIEGSVGSRAYRHLYAQVGEQTVDLAKGGQISCALFVSSVLYHFKMIGDLHATVGSTVADMLKSGWYVTQEYKPGFVLEWEPAVQADGESHGHLGFYMGQDAISHSDRDLSPARHSLDMSDGSNERQSRTIVAVYGHPMLE